jgi:hypothetical protein
LISSNTDSFGAELGAFELFGAGVILLVTGVFDDPFPLDLELGFDIFLFGIS